MKRKLDPAQLRLERNLSDLQFYCRSDESFRRGDGGLVFAHRMVLFRGIYFPETKCYWPESALLYQITDDAISLAMRELKKPSGPPWKEFVHVDRRLPKLRLKKRVHDLITRARDQLPGESKLSKLVKLAAGDDMQARLSLADMVVHPEELAAALEAYRQVEILRCMALPLACWIVMIGHPMDKDFASFAGLKARDPAFYRAYQRFQGRERMRRWRAKKKTLPENVTGV